MATGLAYPRFKFWGGPFEGRGMGKGFPSIGERSGRGCAPPKNFFRFFLHRIVHFGAFLHIIFKPRDLSLGYTTNATKTS